MAFLYLHMARGWFPPQPMHVDASAWWPHCALCLLPVVDGHPCPPPHPWILSGQPPHDGPIPSSVRSVGCLMSVSPPWNNVRSLQLGLLPSLFVTWHCAWRVGATGVWCLSLHKLARPWGHSLGHGSHNIKLPFGGQPYNCLWICPPPGSDDRMHVCGWCGMAWACNVPIASLVGCPMMPSASVAERGGLWPSQNFRTTVAQE